jgi:hypothetical protein
MPSNSGCGRLQIQRVPADLRDFQSRIRWLDFHDITGNPAEAFGGGLFQTPARHQLHADADAEKRPGLFLDSMAFSASFMPSMASRPARQSA